METRAFTPVCTTEIMTFASMKDQFASNNAALVGLSVDSNPSHIEWSRQMAGYRWKDIGGTAPDFPIVADEFGNVARMYGMIMPSVSATKTVRNVFMIDPEGTIRAILIYPLTTGRNMQEILRLLLALQAFDATGNPTPADWKPGEPQIKVPPQTLATSQQRLDDQKNGGYYCIDWYLCFTKPGDGTENAAVMPETKVLPNANEPAPMPVPTPYTAPAPVPVPMAAMPMTSESKPAPKETAPKMQSTLPISTMQAAINAVNSVNPPVMQPGAGGLFFEMPQPGRPMKPDDTPNESISIMDQNKQLLNKSKQSSENGYGNFMLPRDFQKHS